MLPAARISAVKASARPTEREFERWLMQDAGEPKIASIHERMASEYDALANRLELGDEFTDKLFQSACRAIP